MMPPTAAMVTRADNGAARAGASAGTSSSMPKMTGMSVTGMSISTRPDTVGVSTRRKNESLRENAN